MPPFPGERRSLALRARVLGISERRIKVFSFFHESPSTCTKLAALSRSGFWGKRGCGRERAQLEGVARLLQDT